VTGIRFCAVGSGFSDLHGARKQLEFDRMITAGCWTEEPKDGRYDLGP
jgi:hypothetical protein